MQAATGLQRDRSTAGEDDVIEMRREKYMSMLSGDIGNTL
jgi:hypothetical protein